jgi:hypothetical protein
LPDRPLAGILSTMRLPSLPSHLRHALILLLTPLTTLAATADSLFINANPGTTYGDRTIANVTWGDGYPSATLTFFTDTNLVFTPEQGGGQKQRLANNGLAPFTPNNNNPTFLAVYTNTLRLNALIADTGTVTATYTFSHPATLIDLIITDVDDQDVVFVSATDANHQPLAPSNLLLIAEGDLSMTNNAGSRPPLELASPPIWFPATGTLTSAVPFNENRSYSILRVPAGIAVRSLSVTCTGYRPDQDGPGSSGLGSHVYVNLWASPRPATWLPALTPPEPLPRWNIPSRSGHTYRVYASTNTWSWELLSAVTGPPPPAGYATWTDPTQPANRPPTRFFRYEESPP